MQPFSRRARRDRSSGSKTADCASGGDGEQTLLLFVHGLGARGEDTWGEFAEMLRREESFAQKHEFAFFSYPTMLWRWFFSPKVPSIQVLAAGLRSQIDNRYTSFKDIVLVCHSLGGLVAKAYLRQEIMAKRPLRVSAIFLLAVPNDGADLARVGNMLSWSHPQLRQLCRDSEFVQTLNDNWYAMNIDQHVSTKYVIAAQDSVVHRTSAQGRWGNENVETALHKDHKSIVRPAGADDDVVLFLKRFLKEVSAKRATGTGSVVQNSVRSAIEGLWRAAFTYVDGHTYEEIISAVRYNH